MKTAQERNRKLRIPNAGFRTRKAAREMGSGSRENGIALLAVLWLTVALSAMALATSYLVRTEVEAATNRIEGEQMRFLARGGIEAAVDSLLRAAAVRGAAGADGERPEFVLGQRWLAYEFPGGRCAVEVMPENAKLNVNQARPEQLAALFRALGVADAESAELALAIADWRSRRGSDAGSVFDAYYAALPEPYLARHAPLEQMEELLPVKGMSRELFFGRAEQSEQGEWTRTPPLADLLTAAPIAGGVNVNYAAQEVLETLPGWDRAAASRVVEFRERTAFQTRAELEGVVAGTGATTTASPFYTLTATCFHPDSGAGRSVRALVEITLLEATGHQVLGWWDEWPFANEAPGGPQAAADFEAGGQAGANEESRA